MLIPTQTFHAKTAMIYSGNPTNRNLFRLSRRDQPCIISVPAAEITQGRRDCEPAIPSLETMCQDALNLQAAGFLENALSIWTDIIYHYPDFPYSYSAHATTQAILGNIKIAAIDISVALIKFPNEIDTPSAGIQIAMMNNDWVTAAERLTYLREHFPEAPYTLEHASSLESTISKGSDIYQAELIASASTAELAGDWHAALTAWKLLHTQTKRNQSIILGITRCAEALELYDVAANAYLVGLEAQPDDVELLAKYAQLATRQQDWPQAAARWQDNFSRHQHMDSYADLAVVAYLKVGWVEAAEALLDRATTTHPNRLDFWIHYAGVAEKLGRWPEAVSRWDRVLELNPDPFLERLRGEALWRLEMQHMEASGTTEPSRPVPVDDDSEKKLVVNFENLCGKCQLGLVQRYYGAEPLGLFRFAAVTPEKILLQLADNFLSLGDPKHLIIEETEFEYIVKDDRDLYWSHTFINKSENSPDQVLQKQIKRIQFLKRELIDDLVQCAKIFVCTDTESPISDDTLIAIRNAVVKYGDNTILGIRYAGGNNQKGSLIALNNRILIGYIGEPNELSNGIVFDYDSWLSIMRRALAFKAEHKNG